MRHECYNVPRLMCLTWKGFDDDTIDTLCH
jgi:hypothetical protein